MKKRVIVVCDIETGGFSKKKNGICEIAFLVVDNSDLSVIDSFSSLISSIRERPRGSGRGRSDGFL